MYKIEKQDGEIEQYVVKETDESYFKLAPSRGGIVTEFCEKGKSIFWMNWETFFDKSRYVWGGNPVLFPICGALENNATILEGKSCTMPLHGLARNMPWEMINSNAGENDASITLRLESNSETLENYPYEFLLDITYTLASGTLNITACCENLSDKKMPVQLGYHTYFNVTGKGENLIYDTPCETYLDLADNDIKSFLEMPKLTKDQNGKFLLDAGGKLAFTEPDKGYKVAINCEKGFPLMLLWAGDGEKFCIEPWSSGINAMNSKKNLNYIEPRGKWTTEVRISAEII